MKTLIATLISALFVTGAYAQTPAPATPAPHTAKAASTRSEVVEARIAELHQALQITPAEESQWAEVAQAMRDEAKQMDALIEERQSQQDMMSAVDDLNDYARIAQAHADGVKQMVAVFAPLYNSMPDAQKKIADQVFHPHPKKMGMKHRGSKPATTKAAVPNGSSQP
jgi:hypothetical protein